MNERGSAVSRLQDAITKSVPTTMPRRWRPAPRRPNIGVAIAPVRRGVVRVHRALETETRNVVAALVISGAPRLPTTTTTISRTKAMVRVAEDRQQLNCHSLLPAVLSDRHFLNAKADPAHLTGRTVFNQSLSHAQQTAEVQVPRYKRPA